MISIKIEILSTSTPFSNVFMYGKSLALTPSSNNSSSVTVNTLLNNPPNARLASHYSLLISSLSSLNLTVLDFY